MTNECHIQNDYRSTQSLIIRETQELKGIFRFRFHRSISTTLIAGKLLNLNLIVCDEFNNPLENFNRYFSIFVDLIHFADLNNISNSEAQLFNSSRLKPITIVFRNNIISIKLLVPEANDKFHLYIHSKVINSDFGDYAILPLLSGVFDIISQSALHIPKQELQLFCFRIFPHSENYDVGITVKEEYGATVGSIVYDSSVVLIRYLHRFMNHFLLSYRTAIELGAGCGQLSIWLASRFNKVICTDKSYQLPLIDFNARLNQTEIVITSLEWGDIRDVNHASIQYSSELDLLIAADVLYDKDASAELFHAIKRLIIPSTIVLIAQKLRGTVSRISRDEVCHLSGMHADVVFQEADVLIWKLTTTS